MNHGYEHSLRPAIYYSLFTIQNPVKLSANLQTAHCRLPTAYCPPPASPRYEARIG